MNNFNFEGDDTSGSKCLEFIDLALESIGQTIQLRKKNKLSSKMYSSIAVELKELKKVLLCYSLEGLSTENQQVINK